MTHDYTLTGMTCGSCEARVKKNLQSLPGILSVEVSKENQSARISMQKHITVAELQEALGGPDSQYRIREAPPEEPVPETEKTKSWFATYKPVLLIIGFLTLVSLLIEGSAGGFSWMRAMNNYMAGFFLVFAFFKLLNLRGFAENYTRYDILAGAWKNWGYVYAFVELGLGLAFLTGITPLAVNLAAFVIMSLSLVGVLQSVLNKRKIKCACLGDVFNLPMSTVTIIEDAHMIAMSGFMAAYSLL